MDLQLGPSPTRSPHDDAQTEPFSFIDGCASKNHRPPVVVAYKECMKNHAATLGAHAVDGCGEYMPPSPTSLKCAACGCHRNFHRREPDYSSTPPFVAFRNPPPRLPKLSNSLSHTPPPPPHRPHLLFTLGTAEEHHQDPETPTVEHPVGRKRSRTKFSQEQKEKMHSFSEKVGWKLQKSDEAAVEEFCRQVGVAKGVLRAWMHNNKTAFGRKEIMSSSNIAGINGTQISSRNEESRKTHNRSGVD
ncbi:Zinc-finger homeodomain protein 11 [Sesamum alatum]|uniref:Zinc-finger homeodomain protein 11 n=1 Tax=Sesamum alatum TaxID=300844 RepID=A0AAE2CPR8_9LAMI|nr:Zinc-finger homeodomain protein 11 [Sesamum alatum]